MSFQRGMACKHTNKHNKFHFVYVLVLVLRLALLDRNRDNKTKCMYLTERYTHTMNTTTIKRFEEEECKKNTNIKCIL